MIIIGCDSHPGFQQIAFVDTETGDCGEQRLEHSEAAEKFYRDLAGQGKLVRVGMEASGHARWFERLLAELSFELWIGDAAEIGTKTGAQAEDGSRGCPAAAALAAGRSLSADLGSEWGEPGPAATAVAPAPDGAGAHPADEPVASSSSERRAAVQEETVGEQGREQLESFRLAPWASRRREDLLHLLDQLNPTIAELTQAIEQEVEKCPEARRWMTHPWGGRTDGVSLRADHG